MEKFQNGEKNDQQLNDASICGYDSLHHLLKDNLKPHHFQVTLLSNPFIIHSCYISSTFIQLIFNQLIIHFFAQVKPWIMSTQKN
jgi:hypothetical protein